MKQLPELQRNYLIIEKSNRAMPINSQRRLLQRAQEGRRIYIIEPDGSVSFRAFKI